MIFTRSRRMRDALDATTRERAGESGHEKHYAPHGERADERESLARPSTDGMCRRAFKSVCRGPPHRRGKLMVLKILIYTKGRTFGNSPRWTRDERATHLSAFAIALCIAKAESALMIPRRMSPSCAWRSRSATAKRDAHTHARPSTVAR